MASEKLASFQTLIDARTELLEGIQELPVPRVSAFLVSQCERVSDIYTVSAALEGWRDESLTSDASFVLWNYLVDQDRHAVEEIAQRFDRAAFESEEYTVAVSHFSEFSLSCFAGTINYVLKKEGVTGALFAIFDLLKSIYTDKQYGVLDFGSDPKDDAVDVEIMSDKATMGELETQFRQLELLQVSGAPLSEIIEELRRESKSRKLSFRSIQ